MKFVCHQNRKVYESKQEASEELFVDERAITRVLNGYQKSIFTMQGQELTFSKVTASCALLYEKIDLQLED